MTGDRAKSKHSTSTNSYGAVGLVYLGAANNQGFAIMALFPPDGGDGFMPEANAIFSEIQVKPRR